MKTQTIYALMTLLCLFSGAHGAHAQGSNSWITEEYSDYTPTYSSSALRAEDREVSRRSYSSRELSRLRELAPFSPTSNNVSLEIGQIILMGDLAHYEDTLGSAVKYNYGVSRMFGFDAALGRSSHSNGRFSMTSLTGGARMNLSSMDRLVPNLKMGLGFYHPSKEAGALGTVSSTQFGIYTGAGVDLQLSREMFFGTSLTLNNVFNSTRQTPAGPVTLGGSYLSFLASLGYTF